MLTCAPRLASVMASPKPGLLSPSNKQRWNRRGDKASPRSRGSSLLGRDRIKLNCRLCLHRPDTDSPSARASLPRPSKSDLPQPRVCCETHSLPGSQTSFRQSDMFFTVNWHYGSSDEIVLRPNEGKYYAHALLFAHSYLTGHPVGRQV